MAEQDIEEILASAKLPEQTVPVCLRGDLVAAWQQLERRLGQLEDDTLAGDGGAGREIAVQMEELREEMRTATRTFRLRALPRKDWSALLKKHPPGDGEEADFDRDTFPVAAVQACCVDPKMTAAQANKLAGVLTQGQWDTLFGHIWLMNQGQVDVPFSAAASALLAASAPRRK